MNEERIVRIELKLKWLAIVVLLAVFIIAIGNSMAFRFTPTHSIVRESYCYNCHSRELADVSNGTHIPAMPLTHQPRFFSDYAENHYQSFPDAGKTDGQFLDSFCQSCHMNTLQFYRFEVSDPYIFNNSGHYDAVYGSLDFINNISVSQTEDQVVEANLTLVSVNPVNATVDATVSIMLANFAAHQENSTTFTETGSLSGGDFLTVATPAVYPDYLYIFVMLEGYGWNTSTFKVSLEGTTDDGTYLFTANGAGYYFLPYNVSGETYYHTAEFYRTEPLDTVYSDFDAAMVRHITALEGITTSTGSGAPLVANTCSSADTMCHITQKITALGSTIGFEGPDGKVGFYRHDMQYTISSDNCLLCHLNGFSS